MNKCYFVTRLEIFELMRKLVIYNVGFSDLYMGPCVDSFRHFYTSTTKLECAITRATKRSRISVYVRKIKWATLFVCVNMNL